MTWDGCVVCVCPKTRRNRLYEYVLKKHIAVLLLFVFLLGTFVLFMLLVVCCILFFMHFGVKVSPRRA